ncbi:CapA family protein [Calorimonas adulescens]|uniref:CapA family protein n=1 Tax=Calorimonas adulescens TaxID=2606906 RepID=A0A5D8QAV2_9THEO|nr:CapA family protein [Calorimonas adulescens]TZE81592.1 CapA family protein [Calorimonas adulescens]
MKKYLSLFLILMSIFLSGCTVKAVDRTVGEVTYDGGETKEPGAVTRHTYITAVGDIMLGRGVGTRLKNQGYTGPFEDIKPYIQSDMAVGNLECVISERGEKMEGKGIYLRARPEAVETLKYLGFDVLSLANNHTMDYGEDAFMDTVDILRKNGISTVGAGSNIAESRTPYIKDIDGIKVAVLGYNQFYNVKWSRDGRTMEALKDRCGTAPLDIGTIVDDIKKAREAADIVIVMPHWGVEESTIVPAEQRQMAHEMIDAGASVVIGSHPHILQGIEVYKGGLVAYSLGNFVFDQNDSRNKESIVLGLNFNDGKLSEAVISPFVIEDKVKPTPATGEKGEEILDMLKSLSEEFDTQINIEKATGKIRIEGRD